MSIFYLNVYTESLSNSDSNMLYCLLIGILHFNVSVPLIKAKRVRHIRSLCIFPSSTDSIKARFQSMTKELVLDTGKLPSRGLPRNSVVK